MILIAINREQEISLNSICNLEEINIFQSSVNRCVLKILTLKESNEHPPQWNFEDLKIINEEIKNEIRKSIIILLLDSFLKDINLKLKENKINETILEEIILRLNFFMQYKVLRNQLDKISHNIFSEFKKLIYNYFEKGAFNKKLIDHYNKKLERLLEKLP